MLIAKNCLPSPSIFCGALTEDHRTNWSFYNSHKLSAFAHLLLLLFVINIIHGVQDRQEKKQYNDKKTVQESHSITLVTKRIHYEQDLYYCA